MRTPKIDALKRLREFYGLEIENIHIDQSDLFSNAWFAGFFDADGNLYFTYEYSKITSTAIKLK